MRTIGIRHRVKATAEGEARPTQVCILNSDGTFATYDLPDEQAEMDFLLGQFPTAFRSLSAIDVIAHLEARFLGTRSLRANESLIGLTIRVIDGEQRVVTKVADQFDGLRINDRIAMVLGGSGDYFAYALARKGEEVGVSVFRIPASKLKAHRGDADRNGDAALLAGLLTTHQQDFHLVRARDRETIAVREAHRRRIDTMKSRIACEQRLRQRFIGSIFVRPDGLFPEGAIEQKYDELKANDAIYGAVLKEEARCDADLKKLVEATGVWQKVMGPVEGLGWGIAGRIVSGVVDVRRFAKTVTLASDDNPLIVESRERQQNLEELLQGHVELPATSASKAERFQAFYALSEREGLSGETRRLVADILTEYRVRKELRGKLRRVTSGQDKLSAFAGVHVLKDGRFPRRRAKEVSNWNPDVRQALYLLGDQFNRRPNSYWGQKLRANKVHFRTVHPEPTIVNGVKRYSDGHIHRMAIWRTLKQFVVWLHREWTRYENDPEAFVLNPTVGRQPPEVRAAA